MNLRLALPYSLGSKGSGGVLAAAVSILEEVLVQVVVSVVVPSHPCPLIENLLNRWSLKGLAVGVAARPYYPKGAEPLADTAQSIFSWQPGTLAEGLRTYLKARQSFFREAVAAQLKASRAMPLLLGSITVVRGRAFSSYPPYTGLTPRIL